MAINPGDYPDVSFEEDKRSKKTEEYASREAEVMARAKQLDEQTAYYKSTKKSVPKEQKYTLEELIKKMNMDVEIRTRTINFALKYEEYKGIDLKVDEILNIAKRFEKYIVASDTKPLE